MPKSKFTGSVIILANEDDAARTIRPRLDAAGADITKVYIVQGMAREVDTKMFKLIKVLNILNTYSLSILATSMRSARNFFNARPARTPSDVL